MNPTDSLSSDQRSETDPTGLSPLDWPQRTGTIDDVLSELNVLAHRRRRRRRVVVTAFAGALLLAAGVLWRWPSMAPHSQNSVMSIVVVAAPHRVLPDGSTVDLKDGAEIEIAFTLGVRAVTLRCGTAHFQITKNPNRPFVVTAGGIAVRAVGTAFCVEMESKSVEVIVTEGRVSVTQTMPNPQPAVKRTSAPRPAMVGAGEHVVVEAMPDATQPLVYSVTPLGTQELADKLTWLNPRLEFTGTPLEMVIMAFNQHNRRQLVLEDPDLRNLQLSGILRSDNISALLRMLDSNFHIQAQDRGADEIILRKTR